MASGTPARPPSQGARQPAVVVRPARLNDVSRLSAFFLEAWREAGPRALGFAGATDESIREIATEEFLGKRLSTPTMQMTVAEEGRRFIGFASVRAMGGREAELSGIVVLRSEAGKGVGSRLLRKALDGARKRGYASILAKTEVANERAIRFYKGAGFTESGKTVQRIGGSRVELRIMVKRLR